MNLERAFHWVVILAVFATAGAFAVLWWMAKPLPWWLFGWTLFCLCALAGRIMQDPTDDDWFPL